MKLEFETALLLGLLVVTVFYGGFVAGVFYMDQGDVSGEICEADFEVVNRSDVSGIVENKPDNRSFGLCRDLETGEKFVCSERRGKQRDR